MSDTDFLDVDDIDLFVTDDGEGTLCIVSILKAPAENQPCAAQTARRKRSAEQTVVDLFLQSLVGDILSDSTL